MATVTANYAQFHAQEPSLDLKEKGHAAKLLWKRTSRQHVGCFGPPVIKHPMALYLLMGWEIQGPLLETAEGYQETISAFLVDLIQESDLEMRTYTIRSLLLGPDVNRARPYIVIICNHDGFSKQLREKIVLSRILTGEKPPWGCFRLPYAALAVTGVPGAPPSYRSIPFREAPYVVFVEGKDIPSTLNGVSIEIWQGDKFIGRATIGGFVSVERVDGSTLKFAITAAHPFVQMEQYRASGASQKSSNSRIFQVDESELEISFDSDDDDTDGYSSELEGQHSDSSSPTSQKGGSTTTDASFATSLSTDSSPLRSPSFTQFQQRVCIGRLASISELRGSGSCDWALIRLTERASRYENDQPYFFLDKDWKVGDEVRIFASRSRVFKSPILSKALFGLPISKTAPQPVFVLRCDEVERGDCGCWAMSGTRVLGMVIGICLPIKEVYVLPFQDIGNDLYRQAGFTVVDGWSYDTYRDGSKAGLGTSVRSGTKLDHVYSDSELKDQLVTAIQSNELDAISGLCDGADANKKARWLYFASERGDIFAVNELLENGADLEETGHNEIHSPLFFAAIEGHVGVVQLLLNHGMSASGLRAERFKNGETTRYKVLALDEALTRGLAEVISLLLRPEKYSEFEAHELFPVLHRATRFTTSHHVQGLLAAGVDVNEQDEYGATALHYAVRMNRAECVSLLLLHGADATIRDGRGRTAKDESIGWSYFDGTGWTHEKGFTRAIPLPSPGEGRGAGSLGQADAADKSKSTYLPTQNSRRPNDPHDMDADKKKALREEARDRRRGRRVERFRDVFME